MKILSVELKNIGPHKHKRVEFTEPMTAIFGSNGSGKTFLCESVVACLYGVFPTRSGSIYDRITSGYQGEAGITLEFELNGIIYSAARTLRRTGKTTGADARLCAMMGEKPHLIAGPKITDYDRAIVDLLGPLDVFLASVFSSQFGTGDLCDARPGERKEVFTQLLGLGKFDRISQTAKEKAKGIEQAIVSDEAVISTLKGRVADRQGVGECLLVAEQRRTVAGKEIAMLKLVLEGFRERSKEHAALKEKRRGLVLSISRLDSDIVGLDSQIVKDRAEYVRLKSIADRKVESVDLAGLRGRKDELMAKISEGERLHDQAKGLAVLKESLKKQAEPIDKIPGESCCRSCPLVKGAYEAKEKMEGIVIPDVDLAGISALKTEAVEIIGKIKEGERLEKLVEEVKLAQVKIETLVTTAGEKVVRLAKAKEEKQKLEKELSEIPDQLGFEAEIRSEEDKLSRMELDLKGFEANIASFEEQLKSIDRDENQIKELGDKIKEVKQTAEDYREIEKAFGRSGIQPLLIEQARPELEQIANEMLQEATGGKMSVRFQTQKELKSGEIAESLDIIISRNGVEQEIGELSGGEQKVVRTAIRLTLAIWQSRKAGSKLRSIFVDELFDALDLDNSEKMMGLLKSLQSSFDRIIIISHDDSLLESVPCRINLNK